MIPMKDYLEYSLSFKQEELSVRESLMEWLPDEMIDCHAHSNLPEHVLCLDKEIEARLMTTFPSFTLTQSYKNKRIFYPGKTIRTLRFALPFKGIEHKEANEYLLENSRPTDRVALCGVPTDIDYTLKMLHRKGVAGLKMYKYFFNPPADKIYQFFKPQILEEAQALDIPIILHLPRTITECKDDLRRPLKDFPKLTIVLCHLGLPHLPVPGLAEAYKEFACHERLFMDTSLIPSKEVVGLAVEYFGIERIMFGSDEPFNMIRSKPYIHPELGDRLITEYPYHWVDRKEHEKYKHLAKGAIHIHWQALSALKAVIEALPSGMQDQARRLIFKGTAQAIYGF